MKSVNTGAGKIVLPAKDLQVFRLAMRAKLDELEDELLGHLPAKMTRDMNAREKQLLLRGFVRRVTYGYED